MKKLLTATILATTIGTAQAVPSIHAISTPHPTYNASYNAGYREGKDDAYAHVARTAFVVGAVVIAGVLVYHFGKETRWTANEKGVVYRF